MRVALYSRVSTNGKWQPPGQAACDHGLMNPSPRSRGANPPAQSPAKHERRPSTLDPVYFAPSVEEAEVWFWALLIAFGIGMYLCLDVELWDALANLCRQWRVF